MFLWSLLQGPQKNFKGPHVARGRQFRHAWSKSYPIREFKTNFVFFYKISFIGLPAGDDPNSYFTPIQLFIKRSIQNQFSCSPTLFYNKKWFILFYDVHLFCTIVIVKNWTMEQMFYYFRFRTCSIKKLTLTIQR